MKKVTNEQIFSLLQETNFLLEQTAVHVKSHDHRFDRLENRMDGLENRMDGLEKGMDRLENRMDGLENRMDGLEKKIGGLEKKVGGLEKKVGGLEKKVGGLEKTVGSLGKTVGGLGKTVSNLPDKAYLDKKFSDYDRLTRKRNKVLVSRLKSKGCLNKADVAGLREAEFIGS